jgi:hypothetical protein
MEKVSNENKVLKALLKSERCHRSQRHLRDSTIKSEDVNVRHLEEDEQRERNTIAWCLLMPSLFKLCETCKFLIELLYTTENSSLVVTSKCPTSISDVQLQH